MMFGPHSIVESAEEKPLAKEVFTFDGHDTAGFKGWAARSAVTPDGKLIVSAGLNSVRVWELGKNEVARELARGSGILGCRYLAGR